MFFDTVDADGCGSIGVEEVLGGLPMPPENGLTDSGKRVGGIVHRPFMFSVMLALGEVGLQNAMEAVGCGELQDAAAVLEDTRSASNRMLSRWADVMDGGSSGDCSKACVDPQSPREDIDAQVMCRAIEVVEEDTVDGVIGGTHKCKGRKFKATKHAKAKQQLKQCDRCVSLGIARNCWGVRGLNGASCELWA